MTLNWYPWLGNETGIDLIVLITTMVISDISLTSKLSVFFVRYWVPAKYSWPCRSLSTPSGRGAARGGGLWRGDGRYEAWGIYHRPAGRASDRWFRPFAENKSIVELRYFQGTSALISFLFVRSMILALGREQKYRRTTILFFVRQIDDLGHRPRTQVW